MFSAADPWLLTNAYVMHDTGKWKDLNLKVIQSQFRLDFFFFLLCLLFLAHLS